MTLTLTPEARPRPAKRNALPPKLAPDIARVITANRLMRRAAPRHPTDFGRAAQSKWVANYASPFAANVTIEQIDPWTHVLTPENAGACTVHYIHGGGMVYYSATDFLPMLSQMAGRSGQRIMVHSYGKMPERAADACLAPLIQRFVAALSLAGEHVVMGDSVGGLIALHLANGPARGRVQSAVLLYPVLSLHQTFPSYDTFGDGLFLDAKLMLWFRELWAAWFVQNGTDPLAMTTLPCPVTVFGAPCDILADEAREFARRLPAVDLHWLDGQAHDSLLYGGRVPSADCALSQVAHHLKTITKGTK